MSKLIVEVCQIEDVFPHPNADKLDIVRVKGWLTIVGKDQFKKDEKCVFFPPDSVLPLSLANGPDDPIPGRINCMKYLRSLSKDERGNRPEGGRVVAARLRGHVSYGVIMPIDPKFGDDPSWEVGTDLAEYFGITKFEPPQENIEGDAEKPNSKFHAYTSIENIGNYPDVIAEGTEVVFTEKIHGKNCRLGCILDTDIEGKPNWIWAAGSHGVRRKQYVRVEHRFKINDLNDQGITSCNVNDTFNFNGRKWQIESIIDSKPDIPESFTKVHCFQINENNDPVLKISEYWEPLNDVKIKNLLEYVRDEFPWHEHKFSVILFGEIFGAGVQDMAYGLKYKNFRAFDLAINGQYVNFDDKTSLFVKFGVASAPILYRGPFNFKVLEEFTSGPTTLCRAEEAGTFKGREGVVVTPVTEVNYCSNLNGRKILKSISADYLARKNGTEFH